MHSPQQQYQKGALLIEILVALSIFTVLAAIAAQSLYVSTRGGVIATQKEVGIHLLKELMEGARAATDTSWQNLYGLTKVSGHYSVATSSANAWVFTTGDESLTLNGLLYTRYITVANVSRDPSTRAIETVYNAAHDDPSTQFVTAIVSWPGGTPLSVNEYFFRWRNTVCAQTTWSTGGSSGVRQCPDTEYVSKTNLDASSTLQLSPL